MLLSLSAILNFSSGNNGVKCSNETRSLTTSGPRPFIFYTLIKGKYYSPSFGGLPLTNTVSPVIRMELEEVKDLPKTIRGEGGFGSTGK